MNNEGVLYRCPLCGSGLQTTQSGLVCAKKHSFDAAKEGYVHLLPADKMHAKIPGDSKEMVAARRAFLDTGKYDVFARAFGTLLCELTQSIANPMLVDAGCGEGYYTRAARAALEATGKKPHIAAFDISKEAIRAAAKRGGAQWAVASSFSMPLAKTCADVLVDVFSPVAAQEFLRVVKKGGTFVIAVPGPRHLFGLKKVLYDEPYENELHNTPYEGFALERRVAVKDTITVRGTEINNLFSMTPYYWKTSKAGTEKLAVQDSITTEIHFDFVVYRRSR